MINILKIWLSPRKRLELGDLFYSIGYLVIMCEYCKYFEYVMSSE